MDRWIVAGLGNPGARYAGTRHDLGFALVARLADTYRLSFSPSGDVDVAGPLELEAGSVLFARPRSYMNRSGPPLQGLLDREGLSPERMLVACDDVNLPLGRIRLRDSGSAGGHNGLKSLIERVGTTFPRLRMGVGGAPPDRELAEWVLEPFDAEEREQVRDMLERAIGLVQDIFDSGEVRPATSRPAESPSEDDETPETGRPGKQVRNLDD